MMIMLQLKELVVMDRPATNFDMLATTDFDALVDLLRCYSPGHNCKICKFARYGYSLDLCGLNGGEVETIIWLKQPYCSNL